MARAMAQTVASTAMAQAEATAFESQAKSYKPLTTLVNTSCDIIHHIVRPK
ncbi:19003_t:CDS:1, partial [Cetraspora pellucida]